MTCSGKGRLFFFENVSGMKKQVREIDIRNGPVYDRLAQNLGTLG
jgi:hypothetical protein